MVVDGGDDEVRLYVLYGVELLSAVEAAFIQLSGEYFITIML